MRCATCSAEYTPGVNRRVWLPEAVVRIGVDIGWWNQSVMADWRELAGMLTEEQLDR